MATPLALSTMSGEKRNIVVSGSAQGIGRSLSRRLLEAGHRVFLIDIAEDELKYCATQHLSRFSQQLDYAICDLRSPKQIRETIAKAAKFFDGKIDVLISNGGISSPHWKDGKSMEDEDTLDQWQAYVETNLTAPFVLSQACIPFMKRASEAERKTNIDTKAGPCIILVGSFRALMSDENQEGYASSKAGQLGLTHSMAVSLSKFGIRVNLIAPGRIKVAHENREGDEHGRSLEEQIGDIDVEDHAANRAGRPADIVLAVEYLMSAGFVTGQALNVDGGALITK